MTLEQRDEVNFDHPNALETSLLVQHLIQLKQGVAISMPTYDFSTHGRCIAAELVEAKPIILVEGMLLFSCKEFLDVCDIKIFVDAPDDIRLLRRIQRDLTERARTIDSVCQQYLSSVRPMYIEYVEPSKVNADIIIMDSKNKTAIDMIGCRLLSLVV